MTDFWTFALPTAVMSVLLIVTVVDGYFLARKNSRIEKE